MTNPVDGRLVNDCKIDVIDEKAQKVQAAVDKSLPGSVTVTLGHHMPLIVTDLRDGMTTEDDPQAARLLVGAVGLIATVVTFILYLQQGE